MHAVGKPSWVGDISFALSRLRFPVVLEPVHLTDPESVTGLIADIEVSCARALQRDINESEKTVLLKERITSPAAVNLSDVLKYRHYLDVVVPVHRKALTRLVTSCHVLAVNCFRWDPVRRKEIPRNLRLCRFCHDETEDECHAMLYCVGNGALTVRRGVFFSDAHQVVPGIRTTVLNLPPPDSLRVLVREERVVRVLASSHVAAPQRPLSIVCLCWVEVVFVRTLFLKCAMAVADETVEVSGAHPGLR